MKTVLDQLAGYGAYHRDRRNIVTHLVGVPMIVFAVVVLLARPGFMVSGLTVTPALVALVATGVYYLLLDVTLGGLLIAIIAAMLWVAMEVAAMSTATWLAVGVGAFVIGWIIQFVGHYYEGRKPAFVDDILGLLVGPLFVLAEVVFMLGLRKSLRDDIEARIGPTLIRKAQPNTA